MLAAVSPDQECAVVIAREDQAVASSGVAEASERRLQSRLTPPPNVPPPSAYTRRSASDVEMLSASHPDPNSVASFVLSAH